jgi:hypothetical protein
MVALSVVAVIAVGCAEQAASPPPQGPAKQQPQPIAGIAGPNGITYAGGNGLGCDRRVIVQGAQSERDGVGAEYFWLRANYPGYKMRQQGLSKCDGHPTDVLAIETVDGQQLKIYFDISAFFGKGFGL